nr:MAG TPA: hypothetical protein [Caudoviricetes sp.]
MKKATPLLAYSILHSSVAFVCNLGRYYILGFSSVGKVKKCV